MADQLYLSLWYPNFRLEALPAALEKVMEQFAAVGGSARVSAATVYPISWNETPTWQRVYRNETDDEESSPRAVIAAAMENAHEDYAWEFELIWELWVPEQAAGFDTMWRHEPRAVSVVGFGPAFDEGAYETNGHIPSISASIPLSLRRHGPGRGRRGAGQGERGAPVDFTNRIQKNGGISTRLLWSESGESLARKLIERLQQVN